MRVAAVDLMSASLIGSDLGSKADLSKLNILSSFWILVSQDHRHGSAFAQSRTEVMSIYVRCIRFGCANKQNVACSSLAIVVRLFPCLFSHRGFFVKLDCCCTSSEQLLLFSFASDLYQICSGHKCKQWLRSLESPKTMIAVLFTADTFKGFAWKAKQKQSNNSCECCKRGAQSRSFG